MQNYTFYVIQVPQHLYFKKYNSSIVMRKNMIYLYKFNNNSCKINTWPNALITDCYPFFRLFQLRGFFTSCQSLFVVQQIRLFEHDADN